MSIKKLLILSAAGIALAGSASAFAGGPDDMGHAMSSSVFTPAVYFEANGGYDMYSWKNFSNNLTTPFFSFDDGQTNKFRNHNGGGVAGLDIGMQITKNLGIELGGYYLPTLKYLRNSSTNPQTVSQDGVEGTQHNWMGYVAGKLSMPMPYVDGLSLFTKIGAMLRFNTNEKMIKQYQGTYHYWDLVYGAGADYNIMNSGFTVGLQYMRLPSNTAGSEAVNVDSAKNNKKIGSRHPANNLLTGSLGYTFAV